MTTAAPLYAQPTPTTSASAPPTTNGTSNNHLGIPRGPVTASLNFYAAPEDGSVPFQYIEDPPEGQPKRNFGEQVNDVPIIDIRGREQEYTLDKHSFEVVQLPNNSTGRSEKVNFDDDDSVKKTYYPEVEKLLLDNLPGSHKVFLFDHTIRRASPNAHRAPVTRAHIDQTPKSAIGRVRRHFSEEEANELVKGRVRLVNVWRPLNGPVYSHPLGFCDGSSVRDQDVVGIQHRYPTWTGETAGIKYNEGQRWHYLSGMENNERLLLKCFDSDEKVGPVGRLPHTAFVDPRTPDNAPQRESIEVRALVFG